MFKKRTLLNFFLKLWNYCRLERLSLVWQFSIPFFALATIGTCLLLFISYRAQSVLMSRYEERALLDAYKVFQSHIEQRGAWALSLAKVFSVNEDVKKYLKDGNREGLRELLSPTYDRIKAQFSIAQFHFHDKKGYSFLRLQAPHLYGDNLISYRKTIQDVHATRESIAGIEKGITGLSIRGVAPLLDQDGALMGTLEIGFRLDTVFLENIKKNIFMDLSILLPSSESQKHPTFEVMATTYKNLLPENAEEYEETYRNETFNQRFSSVQDRSFRVMIAPFKDYSGHVIGVVEIAFDRSSQLAHANRYLLWMVLLGLSGIIFSVLAIYVISFSFTRPIVEMINFAIKISSGQQLKRLEIQPGGELGILASAINDMLASLSESHRKLEEYSQNLEEMVHIRTRALRESEEKYRTLVENVPIVVYRLLSDGKIVFINRYAETIFGMDVKEIQSQRNFWKEKVASEDRSRVWPVMDRCFKEGSAFSIEYKILLPNGRHLYVREQALPVLDEKGDVEIIDGFLADVSDRYQLQQQIIRTEELKTLSEVSARLAHEIRNPIAVAGGFARRLLQELDPQSEEAKKLNIIFSEIRRLEDILSRTMDYLKPFEIYPKPTDLKEFFSNFFEKRMPIFQEKYIECIVEMKDSLPTLAIDQDLMENGFNCIVRALIFYAEVRAHMTFRAKEDGKFVTLEFTVEPCHISEDDIEHFFYPFTRHRELPHIMDLPLAKIIVHKHGGWIELAKTNHTTITLAVFLPL